MFDVGRSTFNVKDASGFLRGEFSRLIDANRFVALPRLVLSARQFSRTFRKPPPRGGELGIERERLLKESNGALMLIECSEIPSTIGEHGRVNGQHLDVYHVVFLKPPGAVGQATGLQAHVRRVMKAPVGGQIENESPGNKLIVLSEPRGQFPALFAG
jgi:hypothetical protein